MVNSRCDESANSDGFFESPDSVPNDRAGDRISVNSRSFLAKPLQEASSIGRLTLCISNWLSILPGDELGDIVGICNHQVIPFSQNLGALTTCLGAELGKGISGGADG